MKEEEEKNIIKAITPEKYDSKVDDREEITQLLIFRTEAEGNVAFEAKKRFENEKRQMISGETFTIGGLKEEYKQFIADVEKDYEPKFTLFLKKLGILCKWTDEEKSRFNKPRIAPITIIELFYNRFPDGTIQYMRAHNRYVGYFVRRTKNYKLLNEKGIRHLEKIIDEANSLMPKCSNYYEFRKKMFEDFGVPFQKELFDGLM